MLRSGIGVWLSSLARGLVLATIAGLLHLVPAFAHTDILAILGLPLAVA